MREALVGAFGSDILDDSGQVDRKRLAQAVYPDRLEELNGITHPFVVEEVARQVAAARQKGLPAVAVDAIALIESGIGQSCDTVVAVLAPLETRIRRIMARDGIDEAYARRRALAQKGDDFFRNRSDYVLENQAEDRPEDFAARALALFRTILAED
jgi:dephospho-CoA kinase